MKEALSILPVPICLRIDQARRDPFAGSIDDLRARGHLHLARATNRCDAIALNDDDRVRNRRTSVAVNQCSSLNHERILLTLRGHVGRRSPQSKRGRRQQRTCLELFPHLGLPGCLSLQTFSRANVCVFDEREAAWFFNPNFADRGSHRPS